MHLNYFNIIPFHRLQSVIIYFERVFGLGTERSTLGPLGAASGLSKQKTTEQISHALACYAVKHYYKKLTFDILVVDGVLFYY